MHLADFSLGLFGSNGIVGAGVGIAMGAALAAHMRGVDQVTAGFFGDGGANTGRTWEFINLAAVWRLPLIVICENNLYAVETYLGRAMAAESVAKRAAGFGLPVVAVDGQDVGAVYRATAEARQRARSGEGPSFIEALTYRYEGHNTGDQQIYREKSEVELWRRTKDPLLRLRRALESAGILREGQYDRIVEEARATVEEAVEFAEQSPWPDPATARDNVTGLVPSYE
jgi:pyruvate dehydrogenase E1 component alpha subunit